VLAKNVVVLQRPLAVLLHKNAGIPIVDTVEEQPGIGSSVDKNAGFALTGDIASL
jgi:hypothetical protein